MELFITDKCLGLVESLGEFYPEARWQRCMVHFYRNVFSLVPKGKVKVVATMLKAIHAQEDREAAGDKASAIVKKLNAMKLKGPQILSPKASPKHCTTTNSHRSTGGASALTTRSSESCARSAGEPVWSAIFRTATRPHASRGEIASHRWDQVGNAELPRHVSPQGAET